MQPPVSSVGAKTYQIAIMAIPSSWRSRRKFVSNSAALAGPVSDHSNDIYETGETISEATKRFIDRYAVPDRLPAPWVCSGGNARSRCHLSRVHRPLRMFRASRKISTQDKSST